MTDIIKLEDLPTSVQDADSIEAMLAGANANAARVAPCLVATGDDAPSADQLAEAKLALLGAITRWAQAGAGALQQESTGPFSLTVDTRQRTGYNLWPSEITRLQEICATDEDKGAFSVDTAPTGITAHTPWCAINLGASYCDCGAALAGYPIYGAD